MAKAKVRVGNSWVDLDAGNADKVGGKSISDILLVANNLADLANVSTARSNLGLTGNSNTTHYHDSRYYTKSQIDSAGYFSKMATGRYTGNYEYRTIVVGFKPKLLIIMAGGPWGPVDSKSFICFATENYRVIFNQIGNYSFHTSATVNDPTFTNNGFIPSTSIYYDDYVNFNMNNVRYEYIALG